MSNKTFDDWNTRLIQGEIIRLVQPCDCGERIRHNNGGNYHEIIDIQIEENDAGYYVSFDSTCDLIPPAEWEFVNRDRVKSIINHALENGWDIYVVMLS